MLIKSAGLIGLMCCMRCGNPPTGRGAKRGSWWVEVLGEYRCCVFLMRRYAVWGAISVEKAVDSR